MTLSLLTAAVLLGLMGAGHCATMCGPTTIALVSRTPTARQPFAAHVGRILTYALLGALAAALTSEVTRFLRNEVLQVAWFLLPNLLLVLSALYLMGFQHVYAPMESFGRGIWNGLSVVRSFANTRGGVWGDLLRGGLWGLLPCGMIYSALGLAVLAFDPLGAALVMIAFGLSTMPVLLALGVLSQQTLTKLKQQSVRRALGVVLLLLALWNVVLIPSRVRGELPFFLC
jgi:uncharacterized protein